MESSALSFLRVSGTFFLVQVFESMYSCFDCNRKFATNSICFVKTTRNNTPNIIENPRQWRAGLYIARLDFRYLHDGPLLVGSSGFVYL
jgi:hypothetical protein